MSNLLAKPPRASKKTGEAAAARQEPGQSSRLTLNDEPTALPMKEWPAWKSAHARLCRVFRGICMEADTRIKSGCVLKLCSRGSHPARAGRNVGGGFAGLRNQLTDTLSPAPSRLPNEAIQSTLNFQVSLIKIGSCLKFRVLKLYYGEWAYSSNSRERGLSAEDKPSFKVSTMTLVDLPLGGYQQQERSWIFLSGSEILVNRVWAFSKLHVDFMELAQANPLTVAQAGAHDGHWLRLVCAGCSPLRGLRPAGPATGSCCL